MLVWRNGKELPYDINKNENKYIVLFVSCDGLMLDKVSKRVRMEYPSIIDKIHKDIFNNKLSYCGCNYYEENGQKFITINNILSLVGASKDKPKDISEAFAMALYDLKIDKEKEFINMHFVSGLFEYNKESWWDMLEIIKLSGLNWEVYTD